jgi:hypothetical protein
LNWPFGSEASSINMCKEITDGSIAAHSHLVVFKGCDAKSNPPTVPDLTKAAAALHSAVGKLREDPNVPFRRWVPFVHYGL